jgi:hypothetical protein
MSKYGTDPRSFKKYSGNGGRPYVSCCETRRDGAGNLEACSFKQREDKFKFAVSQLKLHSCKFVKMTGSSTLHQFFSTSQPPPVKTAKITEESLLVELASFVGIKNLSLQVAESEEMHLLLIHAIQFGIESSAFNPTSHIQNPFNLAQQLFHHYKKDAIRNRLIKAADEAHRTRMAQFSELIYVAVAVDEGSIRGNKNLDFILECPDSGFKSYPAMTIKMTGQTAKDYVSALSEGLHLISNYKISIGTIVCDGNKAQAKAMNHQWIHSLPRKSTIPWMKEVLFIPCLCHRVHNAYKNVILHDDGLSELTNRLHQVSEECREHVKQLGAICPKRIDTRWVSDYDILAFISARRDVIPRFTEIPDDFCSLFEVLVIFKCLILSFVKPSTSITKAFILLENAILALEELSARVPFAIIFKRSLENYTLKSKDGGIWLLAYLLTPSGRQDIQNRVRSGHFIPTSTGKLKLFKVRGEDCVKDPVEETIEELIDDQLQECIDDSEDLSVDQQAREGSLIEADPKPDDLSDDDQDAKDFTEEELVQKPKEDRTEIHKSTDQIINPGENENHFEEEELLNTELPSVTEFTEEELLQKSLISQIDQAREFLLQVLKQRTLSECSAKKMVGIFNDYLVAQEENIPSPLFSDHDNRYNWGLMRTEAPIWRDLSEIALRLLASPCSEASCERTISTQRLILASRRLKSTKRLLEARLTLMRTQQ